MSDWNQEASYSDKPRKNFLVRWISRLWRWFRNFLAFLGFVYTAVPLLIIWAIVHSVREGHHVAAPKKGREQPSTVWLNLDRPIIEVEQHMSQELLRQLFGGEEGIYVPQIRLALKDAAADSNIKELNLVLDGLHGSMADIEELRSSLVDFKESKKPVTAWVAHMDNAALLISSMADKTILAPASEVMLPGPAFSMIYFGDGIRKLGVDLQVVRAGKYKSAFETFIANDPSPETKEMMGSMESSIRNHMVKLVAEGRKKQDSEAFLWFKESVFTPAKAKELGMVDELGYMPSVDFEDGKNILLEDFASDHSLVSQAKKGYSFTPDAGLGIIEAAGEIVDATDGENVITPGTMQEELDWARNDDDVKAVVLRVASPGGSAAAADQIWEWVRRLNEVKPVIVSMGSVAASGGYYISAPSRKIVADPMTITGSIGVIGMIPSFENFREKYGVTFHIMIQSNRAAILSGSKKMTPEDMRYMDGTIDDIYRTFKSRVADGRKMTLDKVESLAQGRVYTGLQAKELGLVDQIGTLKDAIRLAKIEAGLDENKQYPLHRYEPSQLSLSECLASVAKMRKCMQTHGTHVKSTLRSSIVGEDVVVLDQIKRTKSLLEKSRVLALYPGDVAKF